MREKHYEVVIVGGGISGSALLYQIARYTDIKKIALLEKYEGVATLNSMAKANSQTIHCGDIETNYSYEKAQKVKKTASLITKYCLQHGYNEKFIFQGQKMAIGVGDEEVETIKKRYEEFKNLYPYLEFFTKEDLMELEPNVIYNAIGDPRAENVAGMGVKSGIYTTADYGAMANSFIQNADKEEAQSDIYLNTEVLDIKKIGDKMYIKTRNNVSISADFVVVNAGAHSLFLAHKMGYGLDYSCFPVAGSFYMANRRLLNGKVYMIQNPKLPFAALHGDPDLAYDGFTRFGPTALFMPKLERFHGMSSFKDFIKVFNLDSRVVKVLFDLFKDNDIRNYILKNFLFEIPVINKNYFLKDARKIVPSLKKEDISYAKGFGGVRPQIIDKINKTLLLGEASINTQKGIIFNMTPSPGATSCLGNAKKDCIEICNYLGKNFDAEKFANELEDDDE